MPLGTLKHDYDTHGFVIVRQFLPEPELEELRDNLDRYIHEIVPTLEDGDAFFHDRTRPETLKQLQHMDGDPYFDAYRRHPRWRELAELLIGESADAQAPEWFNKPPGVEHPTPPHQDNYYFCLRPPNVLTMWLAADDVDEENGCLRYVPGSHTRGVRAHGATNILGFSQGISDYGPEDLQREVVAPLQIGDLAVHHGDTIHRADPNRSSSRHRRSFAMVFRGVSCQRDEAAYARYLGNMKRQHQDLGLKVS